MEIIKEIFGWLGCGFNILYYLFQYPPFIRLLKGKLNFEETPVFFITSCYINCFIWYIYGVMALNDQIKYSNLIAGIVSLVFIAIYLNYEIEKYLIDSILNAMILFTGTIAFYRIFVMVYDEIKIVAEVCIGTILFMNIYPIIILFKVIRDKNYILIPIYSACIYLFSCLFWIAYGFLAHDNYIIFPNFIGIILSFIQIFAYLFFKSKYPLIGDKGIASSTIGIEVSENEETKIENIFINEDNLKNIKEKPVKIIKNVHNYQFIK